MNATKAAAAYVADKAGTKANPAIIVKAFQILTKQHKEAKRGTPSLLSALVREAKGANGGSVKKRTVAKRRSTSSKRTSSRH